MNILRYGVVGTGWITRAMIDGAREYDFLRLVAVGSRTRERGETFAAEVGAPTVYTDLTAMAEDPTLELVYIASPNACHAAQCRLFLEHGKHVLCEKPLFADPEEVARLQELAREKGLLFREAIMLLFQPALTVLREAVDQIGELTTAHFQFCQFSSKYEAYCRGETPNIFNPALHTGALMDLGVYCVYPALLLFGEPTGVKATASFLRTGADGAGMALLEYPDKQVCLTYSKTGEGAAPSEILGDRGSVTVGAIGKLYHITLRMNGQPPRVLWESEPKETLMGREIAACGRAILDGQVRDEETETLALAVSRWMRRIREEAGIRFPGE